jgi:hypothetical protein
VQKRSTILFFIFWFAQFALNAVSAQTLLSADDAGNTYELINSKLAPGFEAVETPDCIHKSFGQHISEVWDKELNKYVFEFYSHVYSDNDRCINFDRERVEIKTYELSPKELIGFDGDVVNYKWKFRLPVGFQPSSNFTHIHQIKAVKGDDGSPLFTISVRKGKIDQIELIYVPATSAPTEKLQSVPLYLFEGVWVEATERIKIGEQGAYSITIKKISDNSILLAYSNDNILTIRADNHIIRPKWGIYRSLKNASELRDEAVRFADFFISKEEKINSGKN